jgi:small subunit ribosomal protein S20
MPIIKSTKKALRASKNKKAFNLKRKDAVSKSIKQLKKLVVSGDVSGAQKMFSTVQKSLDKAVKTNYIKLNNASRKKSRLSKMIKNAKQKTA